MWFHMLLLTGFNDRCSFPFTKLVQQVGEDEWDRLERQLDDDEVEAFGEQKVLQLEQYNQELERTAASRALVDEFEPRLDIAQVAAAAAKVDLGTSGNGLTVCQTKGKIERETEKGRKNISKRGKCHINKKRD